MFKFLKEKLKQTIEKVSKKTEQELEEPEEEIKQEIKEEVPQEQEKKGFIKKVTEKVTSKKISESKFNEIFHDLEIVLLANNVALEVIDKIKQDLKKELLEKQIKKSQIETTIKNSLKNSIKEILDIPKIDLDKIINKCKQENKPCVLLVIGYNGSGKSLSCAKLALKLKNKGFNPLLAAGDTYRAAGAAQLVEYGKLVDIPVIHNPETKDSCSVIFDAIAHAKSKKFDVVIADTSGRIHNNQDLMDELKKIARINNPDLTILILDSLTGSDIVEQMKEFDKIIAVDSIILTKLDTNEKGGAFLSATYIGKKPVLYIGSGQSMQDLKEFNVEDILEKLGL